MTRQFTTVPAPDVTIRLADPEVEAYECGLTVDEIQPREDSIGWNLHMGARLNIADEVDNQFGDDRGLHVHLCIGPDLKPGQSVLKRVHPGHLETFAHALLALAARHRERTGATTPAGVETPGETTPEEGTASFR